MAKTPVDVVFHGKLSELQVLHQQFGDKADSQILPFLAGITLVDQSLIRLKALLVPKD